VKFRVAHQCRVTSVSTADCYIKEFTCDVGVGKGVERQTCLDNQEIRSQFSQSKVISTVCP
jgi:hypothetical protein